LIFLVSLDLGGGLFDAGRTPLYHFSQLVTPAYWAIAERFLLCCTFLYLFNPVFLRFFQPLNLSQ